MQNTKCDGEHSIFVAEVIAVESEGKVVVITVCTHCDSVAFHEHAISKAHAPVAFLKNTKDK